MPEPISTIVQVYQLHPELEQDVIHLKEWLTKQLHLPRVSESQLVTFFMNNDRSMEKTKAAIDLSFTIKCACPEFFSDRDPLGDDIKLIADVVQSIPLKVKSPEGYLYVFSRLVNPEPSVYAVDAAIKLLFMVIDSALKGDVLAKGVVLISDVQGFSIIHATKASIYFKKYLLYLQEGMPLHIKHIHLINTTPLITTIMNRMRPFIKKENCDLIHFHCQGPDLESFYKHVPREVLPKEYGGYTDTCEQLFAKTLQELRINREWFLSEEENCKIDETKRIGGKDHGADLLGTQGSFKKLEID